MPRSRRDAPPNIDELGNLVLLRQALDILAATEETQLSLYPADRDPSTEMAALFADAWGRVRPVFEPLLAVEPRNALLEIASQLEHANPDWARVREHARVARPALPGRSGAPPRAWHDQIVRHETRLFHRSQLPASPSPDGAPTAAQRSDRD